MGQTCMCGCAAVFVLSSTVSGDRMSLSPVVFGVLQEFGVPGRIQAIAVAPEHNKLWQ